MAFKVKLLTPTAKIPSRATCGSAGYDICSDEEAVTIRAGSQIMVKTGISLEFPSTFYARVAPRSGLANKYRLYVGAGVIDSDYRGEVCVILFNHGQFDFLISRGDRIAQLIFESIVTPELVIADSISTSVRGSDGFGSTGVSSAIATCEEENVVISSR